MYRQNIEKVQEHLQGSGGERELKCQGTESMVSGVGAEGGGSELGCDPH